jgi:hypothetical protein
MYADFGSAQVKALIATLGATISKFEAAAPALADGDTKPGTRTTARRHFGAVKKGKDKQHKPKGKCLYCYCFNSLNALSNYLSTRFLVCFFGTFVR